MYSSGKLRYWLSVCKKDNPKYSGLNEIKVYFSVTYRHRDQWLWVDLPARASFLSPYRLFHLPSFHWERGNGGLGPSSPKSVSCACPTPFPSTSTCSCGITSFKGGRGMQSLGGDPVPSLNWCCSWGVLAKKGRKWRCTWEPQQMLR